MSGIVRWTPSNHLFGQASSPGFSRLIDDFFARPARFVHEDEATAGWVPATDVKETDAALFVYVELPGLHKDDVEVSLENSVLEVRGERRFAKDDTKETYHRRERLYGKFSRSFRLPRNVDGAGVSASFVDGLLTLELPKAEEARPRQIEIN